MPLLKINAGTNEDGTVRWHYIQDPPDASKPVVLTGPAVGTVELADGTTYDVTDHAVEVDSAAHAGEVAHLIGLMDETPDHECNEFCPTAKGN